MQIIRIFKTRCPNGSYDKTCEKVAGFIYSGNNKVKIQSYFPNRGKGYALKYGTDFANGNHILFLEADLDLHSSQLMAMYKIMQDNNADFEVKTTIKNLRVV